MSEMGSFDSDLLEWTDVAFDGFASLCKCVVCFQRTTIQAFYRNRLRDDSFVAV